MIYRYQKIQDEHTTYTLVEPDMQDDAARPTELVTLDGWTYVLVPDGVDLPRQSTQVADTLEAVGEEMHESIRLASPIITDRTAKISRAVNAYINAHYDQGTQASFQALYVLPSTSDEDKLALLPVWDWIAAVMAYYYDRKREIMESDNPLSVTWDFSQFDSEDPGVSLSDFMGQ